MTHIAVLRACLALAVVLGTATIASAGSSGFGAATVRIGPNGLEPSSLRIAAYHDFTVWQNDDSVAHTLEFEDGRCSLTLAAGGRGSCERVFFLLYAGTYRYRLGEGLDAYGEVVVKPNQRSVTMAASRATVRAGQSVTIGGTVSAGQIAPGHGMNMPQWITLLRRTDPSRGFVPIRRVHSCLPRYCIRDENRWSVTIRPTATATYVARSVDPPDRTVWAPATSSRLVVRVLPAPRVRDS